MKLYCTTCQASTGRVSFLASLELARVGMLPEIDFSHTCLSIRLIDTTAGLQATVWYDT